METKTKFFALLFFVALGTAQAAETFCDQEFEGSVKLMVRPDCQSGSISIHDDILTAVSGSWQPIIALRVYQLPSLTLVKVFDGCGNHTCYYDLKNGGVSSGASYRFVATRYDLSTFSMDLDY